MFDLLDAYEPWILLKDLLEQVLEYLGYPGAIVLIVFLILVWFYIDENREIERYHEKAENDRRITDPEFVVEKWTNQDPTYRKNPEGGSACLWIKNCGAAVYDVVFTSFGAEWSSEENSMSIWERGTRIHWFFPELLSEGSPFEVWISYSTKDDTRYEIGLDCVAIANGAIAQRTISTS